MAKRATARLGGADSASATHVEACLLASADPVIAEHSSRFFKTGPGEYGEGDHFLGLRVPEIRKVVRANKTASLATAVSLLNSKWHEVRLAAVLFMVQQFKKAGVKEQGEICRAYLANAAMVNNWDLVDLSAPHIVGGHYYDRSRKPLYRMAKSKNLWNRRISIMATFYFIRQVDFDEALAISEILLHDDHDLIHKAVGWMLREIGNRDLPVEETFLKKHYQTMPRTMLRYAIEKFPEKKRQAYLKGTI